jgi:hypothetical protein
MSMHRLCGECYIIRGDEGTTVYVHSDHEHALAVLHCQVLLTEAVELLQAFMARPDGASNVETSELRANALINLEEAVRRSLGTRAEEVLRPDDLDPDEIFELDKP